VASPAGPTEPTGSRRRLADQATRGSDRRKSEGEVVDAYDSVKPYVRVAIDLLGTDEVLTLTFHLDQVESANAA
jgi:hypothetical protein